MLQNKDLAEIKSAIKSLEKWQRLRLKVLVTNSQPDACYVSIVETDLPIDDVALLDLIYEIAPCVQKFDIRSLLVTCSDSPESCRARYVQIDLLESLDRTSMKIALDVSRQVEHVTRELNLQTPVEIDGTFQVEYLGAYSVILRITASDTTPRDDDAVKLLAFQAARSLAKIQHNQANQFFVQIKFKGETPSSVLITVPIGLIVGTNGQILLSEIKASWASQELICCGGWGPYHD